MAGLLQVASNSQIAQAETNRQQAVDDSKSLVAMSDMTGLAGFIRTQYTIMKNHRTNSQSGWNERMLNAMRCFKGEYDSQKLAEIQRFGGSAIYARLIAMKCRGASALLRDVYLTADRPWGLNPPDDPSIPPDILASIKQLVMSEVSSINEAQQSIDPDQIRDRLTSLIASARDAAKRNAQTQAQISEDKIDEILKNGGFYNALSEFLTDLPLFPFACIKGPVVRIVPEVVWNQGKASIIQRPRLEWVRVSPFDLWWTPGVSRIEDAAMVERSRLTRANLNDLLDLPGYNQDNLRMVLDLYGRGGLDDDWDTTDSQRAVAESRENPRINRSDMISCLEYHGNIQGRMLDEYGFDTTQITGFDPLRDYFVQCWLIGQYVIKVQLAPSPRKRHPYYITSFEKVPGTPVGNALPDILADIQESANAALRALNNNMAMSSGPQVVVNEDRIQPGTDGEELYPWKRWRTTSDPFTQNSTQKPVEFFQPQSNSQELLSVYQAFSAMADDLSAIPRYLQGSGATGGAGRTASGLAMLMGNASKILQTVAGNVDRDIFDPSLTELFDMLMLTDTSGLLTGEEKVQVMGVSVAIQKETQRARQMEFLQATTNPMDIQIIGPKGRAAVLRVVADGLGMPGEEIVPTADELDAQQKAAQAQAQAQGVPGHSGLGPQAAQAQGNQPPQGGAVAGGMGPRLNLMPSAPAGGAASP